MRHAAHCWELTCSRSPFGTSSAAEASAMSERRQWGGWGLFKNRERPHGAEGDHMNGGRTLRRQIPHLGIQVIFEVERHVGMNRWRCAVRRSGVRVYGRIWCGNGIAVWTGRPINFSVSRRLRSNPDYRVFGIQNLIHFLRLPVTHFLSPCPYPLRRASRRGSRPTWVAWGSILIGSIFPAHPSRSLRGECRPVGGSAWPCGQRPIP